MTYSLLRARGFPFAGNVPRPGVPHPATSPRATWPALSVPALGRPLSLSASALPGTLAISSPLGPVQGHEQGFGRGLPPRPYSKVQKFSCSASRVPASSMLSLSLSPRELSTGRAAWASNSHRQIINRSAAA